MNLADSSSSFLPNILLKRPFLVPKFVGRQPAAVSFIRAIGRGFAPGSGARFGTRRQLIFPHRALFFQDEVARAAPFSRLIDFQLFAFHIGIVRPGRIMGERGAGFFRRRQGAALRDHQRRALLIVDRFAVFAQTEAFKNAAENLGVERHIVVGGARRGGQNQHAGGEGQTQGAGCESRHQARQTHGTHPVLDPWLRMIFPKTGCRSGSMRSNH